MQQYALKLGRNLEGHKTANWGRTNMISAILSEPFGQVYLLNLS